MNKNTISEKSIAEREECGSAGQHQGAVMKKAWPTQTMQSLCEDVNVGHVGPSSMHRDPNGISFLMGKNVGTGVIYTHNIERVTEAFHRSQPKSRLRSGDIVVVRIGKSGQAAKIPEGFGEANCSGLVVIKQPHGIHPDFLVYYLNSPIGRGYSLSQARGSTRLTLNTSSVAETLVPAPPLAEQQRIVGLLDEAFEGLATAKANAEKNLQNARALFESHLQSVFTQRGPGWVEKPLGEVCVVKDGTHDSPKYVADGIPFVTQKNIREDGLSFEKTKFISQVDHDDFYRRSNAAHGDILISMIGANRGMACIVDDERTFSIKNVGLVKQNPSINQEFLLYFLKSPQAASFVKGASKGGAQEFVGLTELRRFPVPLPSLELQNAFAETFQSLRAETQRLARLYESKLTALAALKKSLLHQAFTGQL